jgi:hypothetical protein
MENATRLSRSDEIWTPAFRPKNRVLRQMDQALNPEGLVDPYVAIRLYPGVMSTNIAAICNVSCVVQCHWLLIVSEMLETSIQSIADDAKTPGLCAAQWLCHRK